MARYLHSNQPLDRQEEFGFLTENDDMEFGEVARQSNISFSIPFTCDIDLTSLDVNYPIVKLISVES